MELQEHVLSAIDGYNSGKLESALMHACIAIEGTARKLYQKESLEGGDYKKCLRDYYWIIEPMIGGGLNQVETVFNNVKIYKPNGKIVPNPDLADVIYHIFRCNLVHSKSVPIRYQPLTSPDGISRWSIGDDVLSMPDRIIWALLAVSVFSGVNEGIKTNGDYFLSWGSDTLGLGVHRFIIRDFWGKENEFREFLSRIVPKPVRVKLEGLQAMQQDSPSKSIEEI